MLVNLNVSKFTVTDSHLIDMDRETLKDLSTGCYNLDWYHVKGAIAQFFANALEER